jgi:hypothetical protein
MDAVRALVGFGKPRVDALRQENAAVHFRLAIVIVLLLVIANPVILSGAKAKSKNLH